MIESTKASNNLSSPSGGQGAGAGAGAGSTLCLDFGNTRLKAALFTGDVLREVVYLRPDAAAHLTELLDTHRPGHAILSSVIDHDPAIDALLADRTRYHRLSSQSKLPFTIPVGKPETMGADRIAAAAAAVHLFPGRHNLVIALGTCITYNFIAQEGAFLGGAIAPGMAMRFRAMHEYTAKLPLVAGTPNVPLVGYDTATNLQSGVVLGMAFEIDGFINAYRERYGNFNALLTGGDTGGVSPHLKNKIFADPELIFKGLYAISRVNTA
ncbi:type III pantothenate kinase [Flaviaesturariibacter amylovorans]|uniref:Type III pantothenate kinase n=1 Tax=Flaviaesturariibacter amylovorans TaxID=1084520 RepID=A0ABP8HJN5_9BACT